MGDSPKWVKSKKRREKKRRKNRKNVRKITLRLSTSGTLTLGLQGYSSRSWYMSDFGPDVLACATRGGGRSEAGHCFHLLLVQACLRAPHVVADEAKLAIVFTYFFLSFFFLSPTPSAFHPLRGISRA